MNKDIYILGFKYLDEAGDYRPLLAVGYFTTKKAVEAEVKERNEQEKALAAKPDLSEFFRQGEWRYWSVYNREKFDFNLK